MVPYLVQQFFVEKILAIWFTLQLARINLICSTWFLVFVKREIALVKLKGWNTKLKWSIKFFPSSLLRKSPSLTCCLEDVSEPWCVSPHCQWSEHAGVVFFWLNQHTHHLPWIFIYFLRMKFKLKCCCFITEPYHGGFIFNYCKRNYFQILIVRRWLILVANHPFSASTATRWQWAMTLHSLEEFLLSVC